MAQASEVTARPSPRCPGVNAPPVTSERLTSHSRPVGVPPPSPLFHAPCLLPQRSHENLCAHLMPPRGSLPGSGAGGRLRAQRGGQAGVRAAPRGGGRGQRTTSGRGSSAGLHRVGAGLSEQGCREAAGTPKEPGPTGSVLVKPLATERAAGRALVLLFRLRDKLGPQNNGCVFSRARRLGAGDQGPRGAVPG